MCRCYASLGRRDSPGHRPAASLGLPRWPAAAERDAQEKADFEAKIKAREDMIARTGKKPGGKPPAPPRSGVRPTDQINLMALALGQRLA